MSNIINSIIYDFKDNQWFFRDGIEELEILGSDSEEIVYYNESELENIFSERLRDKLIYELDGKQNAYDSIGILKILSNKKDVMDKSIMTF